MINIEINYMPKAGAGKVWGVSLTWQSTITSQFHGVATKEKSEPTADNVITAVNKLLQAAEELTKEESINVKSY